MPSKTCVVGFAALAVVCSSTRGLAAADLPVPPTATANAKVLAAPTFEMLAEAPSDGTEVAQLYLKSTTVNDVTVANQRLEQIVLKVRSSEGAVNKLYEGAMRSCDRANDLDPSKIEAVVSNVRRLDSSLADIDVRLKRSVETMRQNSATAGSGILAFRMSAELRRFESAYTEYARLKLSIHELANGLSSLWRDLPKAQQLCRPLMIPPLNADAPALPTSRPQATATRSHPAIKPSLTARGSQWPLSKAW